MKTNASSFKKSVGACGAVGAAAVAIAFYGCSSSSSPATPVSDDGGPDSSTTGGDDGGTPTPVPDSGTTTPKPDGGGDAGSSLILQKVAETKLIADTPDAGAAKVDPNLLNAWGLAFNPSGTAWVSDNHAGVATLYSTAGGGTINPLVVTIPLPGPDGGLFPAADSGLDPSAPTGQIFNASAAVPDAGTTGDFLGDLFILSAEDGTISGWQKADGTQAVLRVDMSGANASFKGLQIVPATPPVLLAADFHNGAIDAFDTNYAPIAADAGAGAWHDPSIPAGYAPFNIYATGTSVYVAYAKQDAQAGDDTPGAGNGAVSVFSLTGALVKSLIPQTAGGPLNAPWGLTTVPTGGWGSLPAGALLVGNFGDGTIHAFDATSGALLGTFVGTGGTPLLIDGLWALAWGPNSPQAADAGTLPTQLFFTAGPNKEADGLYGYLTAQ